MTVHPSFLLRIPEEDRRHEERALFVRDLKQINSHLVAATAYPVLERQGELLQSRITHQNTADQVQN